MLNGNAGISLTMALGLDRRGWSDVGFWTFPQPKRANRAATRGPASARRNAAYRGEAERGQLSSFVWSF